MTAAIKRIRRDLWADDEYVDAALEVAHRAHARGREYGREGPISREEIAALEADARDSFAAALRRR